MRQLKYDIDSENIILENPKCWHSDSDIPNHIKDFFDEECNQKIKKIAKTLIKNKYEDDKYLIKPASTVKEMLDEGKMQNNCLRTYIEQYSKNNTHIYLMRKKSS